MRTITVAQAKGGTGKTNVAYHIAHALAEKRRVLVIDLDPQQAALSEPLAAYASATPAAALFVEPTEVEPVGPITLLPRSGHLSGVEREDLDAMARNFIASLRTNANRYDVCVIDTPPAQGTGMAAAILAADLVVSPVELQEASLNAVQSVVDTIAPISRQAISGSPDRGASAKPTASVATATATTASISTGTQSSSIRRKSSPSAT